MIQQWVLDDLKFTNRVSQYAKARQVNLILSTPQTSNSGLGSGYNRYFDPDIIDGKRIVGIEVIAQPGWTYLRTFTSIVLADLINIVCTFKDVNKRTAILHIPATDILTNDTSGTSVNQKGKLRLFDFRIDLKSSYVNYNNVSAKLAATVYIPFTFYYID